MNMPALSVSIDGLQIATVCTDGYDVLNVRASGTCIDDHLADLDVSGGSYPENGDQTHLTWVNELHLQPGQVVTISFLEHASSSHAGKTIEDLFPDEMPTTVTDFKPTAEMYKELRATPKLHDKFSFRLASSSGASFVGETAPDAHVFGFSVLWNSHHPERARVSLHSYTLDSLESRGPMNNHFEERINYGGSVRFELIA
jgi:hypothetical protein